MLDVAALYFFFFHRAPLIPLIQDPSLGKCMCEGRKIEMRVGIQIQL